MVQMTEIGIVAQVDFWAAFFEGDNSVIPVIQSNTLFLLMLLDDAATLDYSISMERDSDTSIYCFGATCCYLTGSSLAISSILLYIITKGG